MADSLNLTTGTMWLVSFVNVEEAGSSGETLTAQTEDDRLRFAQEEMDRIRRKVCL